MFLQLPPGQIENRKMLLRGQMSVLAIFLKNLRLINSDYWEDLFIIFPAPKVMASGALRCILFQAIRETQQKAFCVCKSSLQPLDFPPPASGILEATRGGVYTSIHIYIRMRRALKCSTKRRHGWRYNNGRNERNRMEMPAQCWSIQEWKHDPKRFSL